MCGITGFLGLPPGDAKTILQAMNDRLAHRGPDDEGTWIDGEVALAQRRLSIIDLSPAGHQPMLSRNGRFALVLNGEIYNYSAIRSKLEQERGSSLELRGHSDTEVLLAAIERWGLARALEEAAGMFALAVWDGVERTLTLARDRAGEKPLYYGVSGDTFLFASELRAFRAFPGFSARIDRDVLAEYLRRGCVPGALAIYEGTRKLPPGTLLVVRPGATLGDLRPIAYWSLREVAADGARAPFRGDAEAAADELDALLAKVVRECMVSDVPLGVFLSGGVDSSTIAAFMQAASDRPVRSFCIGFTEPEYNEADAARAVAAHLGTDHVEHVVTPDDMLAVASIMPRVYDEPFADSSQIPTFLVARIARQHVTVALTGDGGDEVFGGYVRYAYASELWRKVSRVPARARRFASRAALGLSPTAWDRIARPFRPLWRKRVRDGAIGGWVHRSASTFGAASFDEFYLRLISVWDRPEDVVIGATGAAQPVLVEGREDDIAARMMLLDFVGYLQDDVLAKVDRASMAVALETRAPLLDKRVVEFAWRLPTEMRVQGRVGKPLLKAVLHRHVPRSLVDRPKRGFAVPLASWLRGPLRDLLLAELAPEKLAREGHLRPEPVRRAIAEHMSGARDHAGRLWALLMFELWLRENPPLA
jgi:asparagine synthase (glutamine-hydrolysing)